MRSFNKSPRSNRMQLAAENRRLAKRIWPGVRSEPLLRQLTDLSKELGISVGHGEIIYLDGKWYVTHAGLLKVALNSHCCGIQSSLVQKQCDPLSHKWVFRAIVYKSRASRGFVGYGDADPSNVSPLVRGAEMRIAETRAVNRALRKAYGIGLCSVEELGWSPKPTDTVPPESRPAASAQRQWSSPRSPPRLRDQLCLLIRQYELDPNLVKAYAAHFCGTETIKEASRDLVESFISHLAASAKEDRDGLICKLNSFAPVEVQQ